MADPSFQRYLLAKRTVDDRALNRAVFTTFKEAVLAQGRALRFLEIGAGLGTMLARLVTWGVLQQGEYTLVDRDPQLLQAAQAFLKSWAEGQDLEWHAQSQGGHLHGPGLDLRLRWLAADVYDPLPGPRGYDVVLGHAVLDLLHLPTVLPRLLDLLRPGGLAYFTLNFDGVTIFEPPLPGLDEDRLLDRYHAAMDARIHRGLPAGAARTGRQLFHQLRQAGAEVLAMGASDWVVFPTPQGVYPHDEAFFLTYILETIYQALKHDPTLDPQQVETWYTARRVHLQQGELVYIAHQVDVLARRPRA